MRIPGIRPHHLQGRRHDPLRAALTGRAPIATWEEPPTEPQIRLWSLVSGTGLERFELTGAGDGFRLEGTILVFDQQAYEVRYRVHCDAQWRTTAAAVDLRDAAGERRLSLVTREGRWHAGGR